MNCFNKASYDASNERDVSVRKVEEYVRDSKIVPLLNVLSSICRVKYANDRNIVEAVKLATAHVLEHGLKDDVITVERCLRSNIGNQSSIRYKGLGDKTLLGAVSEELLKREEFALARPAEGIQSHSCHISRYKPIAP